MATLYIPCSTNKSIEIQVNLFDEMSHSEIFDIYLGWSVKQDHAGVRFHLTIFHLLYASVMLYDHRHWDYDNDKWEEYDDSHE